MKNSNIVIPKGYRYVIGQETTGFVIESLKGNQYVWIPEGKTKEYGYCEGFFVSRYEISQTDDGSYASKTNEYPIVDRSFADVVEIAKILDAKVISDKQFDRIVVWLMEVGDKTEHQVYEDSSEFGNYKNSGINKMAKTGYDKKWMCRNIDNLAGNLWTWTCTGDDNSKFIRGGSCDKEGWYAPLARRARSYLKGSRYYIGLRVVL